MALFLGAMALFLPGCGVADVAFQINETASRWLGDSTVSAAAAALPELKGFGEVKDLHAAANDSLERLRAA